MKQNFKYSQKVFLISILLSYYTLQVKGQTSTPPPAPTNVAVDKSIICPEGSIITLTAEGIVGQVAWYKNGCSEADGGIKIGEGNNLQLITNSAAIYYARNLENGLYSLSCASVEVKILQTIPDHYEFEICPIDVPIILTAHEALAYIWSTGETTREISVYAPGLYTVQLIAGDCNYAVQYNITSSAPEIHTIWENQPHCPDEVGSIGLELTHGGEVSYTLDGGVTFLPLVILNTGQLGIPNLLPGSYNFKLRDEFSGCISVEYQAEIHFERLSYGPPIIAFTQQTNFPEAGSCYISKEKMNYIFTVTPRQGECDGLILNIDPIPDIFPIGITDINYTIENVWGEIYTGQLRFIVEANAEICNGLDDDCDGQIDEEALTSTYYRDADGDGYGISTDTKVQCQQPSGYAPLSGDCNDKHTGINPGSVWCRDTDNDGYGDGIIMTQCEQPEGFKAAACLIATHGDCNDNNPSVHPGATEICGNGIDDDCNDLTSDICSIEDNDNDGDPDATDCDDNNPNIHHEATEVCNGVDDNCNGIIDENTSIAAAITPTGTQNLCSGETLTLFASPVLSGNSYVWYKNNKVIDNQTGSTLLVTSGGDYKVKITLGDCTATSTATTVILIAPPNASIKISGKNSNPCNGAVQLVANNVQGTYEWYKDGELQNSDGSNFNATTAGEYWVVITKNGCSTESNHILLSCPSSRATSAEAVHEISNVQKDLKVRPNPATHFLDVQWTTKNTSQTSIRILNAEGKTVKTFTTQGAVSNQRISLEGLAKGIYMVVLKTGSDQQVTKFVIQ